MVLSLLIVFNSARPMSCFVNILSNLVVTPPYRRRWWGWLLLQWMSWPKVTLKLRSLPQPAIEKELVGRLGLVGMARSNEGVAVLVLLWWPWSNSFEASNGRRANNMKVTLPGISNKLEQIITINLQTNHHRMLKIFQNLLQFWKRTQFSPEIAFCYQICSDLLWEKIVLVIEKNFKFEAEGQELQKFWNH